MAKFRKMVVSEGVYYPYNPTTMRKERREVTRDDLEKMVTNFNKQLEKGHKVPAPWRHDMKITAFPIEEGDKGLLEDSSKNAGFWDKLESVVNSKGKLEVWGEVDVPGEPDDPNTPAGKVGKTVKDTSIYLRSNFEDGHGEKWDKAVMHIALVTHPIEAGQPNFELTDPNDSYLAMSELESDDTSLADLINKLKKVCKVYLPPNTTSENLHNNLLLAVSQLELVNDEDGDGDSDDSQKYKAEPVIMSHFSKEQIDALIATKAVNPVTKQPFVPADFEDKGSQQKPTQDGLVMSAILNQTQSDRRRAYRSRIDNLVETGRTTKAYADTSLYPKADSYQVEVTATGIQTPLVEELIMSLESQPAPQKGSTGNDYTVMNNFGSGASAEDEKELDRIADALVSGSFID